MVNFHALLVGNVSVLNSSRSVLSAELAIVPNKNPYNKRCEVDYKILHDHISQLLSLSGLIWQTTKWQYFTYFYQKTGFDISCKLSPMKCQILFTMKNKANVSKCYQLKILSRVLIINPSLAEQDMPYLIK